MNENERAYQGQKNLAAVGFLMELPGFVLMAAAAFATGSLIVLADFIDCLCNVVRTGFTLAVSRKLSGNLKYEYNFGKGKVEAISALFCDALLIVGLVIVALEAVQQIFTPEAPSELLFWVVLLKVGNVACDAAYAWQQRKLLRQSGGSLLIHSEYFECIHALAFDLFALAALFLCFALRGYKFSWYLTPVCSLVLVGVFAQRAVTISTRAVNILTDRTLPEEQQLRILKELNSMYNEYEELVAINSRLVGETPFIELRVKFAPETTCAQMRGFKERISQKLTKQIPAAVVTLTIE